MPTDRLYSLVRARLGPDATMEMIESVTRKVAKLLAEKGAEALPNDQVGPAPATPMLLIATGLDSPEAGLGLMEQLRSYDCQVLGSDQATADGYLCLLVSFDAAGCSLSLPELMAALEVAGAAEGLDVAIKNAPSGT